MGRAGGGGGGHSHGGGGGSHRSSGGRIGGGSSSSHRSSYSGGGYRSSPTHSGGYYGGPPRHYHNHYYGGRSSGNNIFGFFILYVIIFFIMFVSVICITGTSASITPSTIQREPLSTNYTNETNYYTDELSWIWDSETLESGMKHFYKETGVQPYLYITDTVNGTHTPTENDFEVFSEELYDELFTDEAHLLLIFHEYNETYSSYYICGAQAKTVIDNEAANILLDFVDHYYYSDYSEDEMFSKAFSDTADRIMTVTEATSVTIVKKLVVPVIVLIIITIAFCWWKKKKKQDNLEAEQTEKILNTPLQQFGDDSIDDLENKYNN